MSDAVLWYHANAEDVSRRYESVAAEIVHGWLVDLLPSAPALVLDVGAGTVLEANEPSIEEMINTWRYPRLAISGSFCPDKLSQIAWYKKPGRSNGIGWWSNPKRDRQPVDQGSVVGYSEASRAASFSFTSVVEPGKNGKPPISTWLMLL